MDDSYVLLCFASLGRVVATVGKLFYGHENTSKSTVNVVSFSVWLPFGRRRLVNSGTLMESQADECSGVWSVEWLEVINGSTHGEREYPYVP